MAAGRYDFDITQGQTFGENWNWNSGADISGYTANLRIFQNFGDSPLLALNSGNGVTLGTSDPNVVITMSAAQTTLLIGEILKYDFELINSGGIVTKSLYGFITILKENV